MKKFTFLFAILLIAVFAKAQITFQKTYGGTGYDNAFVARQTADSGYIFAGRIYIAGKYDAYVVKTDANGDTLWTKLCDGIQNISWSILQTTDGGYINCGSTVNSGLSHSDVYLFKLNANGDTIWTRSYGRADNDAGYSMQQTTDGGYIIAGVTQNSAGNDDIYLIKTDSIGNPLWTKTFGKGADDEGLSVQQTTDGGYIIGGYTYGFGAADYDFYLIKTDSLGDSLWTKTYGGTGDDRGTFVQQTTDGGYIFTGLTNSFGAGSWDVYLIKTDPNGNSVWSKTYGGSNDDRGTSVYQTTDGGYIISGFTQSFGVGVENCYLIKTDTNGDTLWIKTFGGTMADFALSVQQTMDKGYIIAGASSSFGAGDYDAYLIKTDSLGNSGCNEGNTSTIVNTPLTQVSNPSRNITSPPVTVIPPTLIIGSGSSITTLCTTVSINEIITGNSFNIFPDPSSGAFEIKFSEIVNKGSIEIYSVPGERIYSENIFNESKKEINVENIAGGIYFVKVFDGEKSYCKKIIVE